MKKFIVFLLLVLPLSLASQSISIKNIDKSNYPDVSAEVLMLNQNYEIVNDLSSVRLYENFEEKNFTYTCPEPVIDETMSSVLTIDVSGSMGGNNRIGSARIAAKRWVELMDMSNAECAVTSFDGSNYLNQDFTTDKDRLSNAIDGLSPSGGTNFNAALYEPLAGAIQTAARGQYRPIVVLLTDGNGGLSLSEAVNQANQNDVTVFTISVDNSMPSNLKSVAEQTGGAWFENVTSGQGLEDAFAMIYKIATIEGGCTIEWKSGGCETKKYVEAKVGEFTGTGRYEIDESFIRQIVLPNGDTYDFGIVPAQTTEERQVELQAINGESTITDITTDSDLYEVVDWGGSAPPFNISPGNPRTITIEFTSVDDAFRTAVFRIESDACISNDIYCRSGDPTKPAGNRQPRVVHPNGGELFLAESDTIIRWDGVLPGDEVTLEYSTDAGENWNLIERRATDLKYDWNNLPDVESERCLVKVSMYDSTLNTSNALETSGLYHHILEESEILDIEMTSNSIYVLANIENELQYIKDIEIKMAQNTFLVLKFDIDYNIQGFYKPFSSKRSLKDANIHLTENEDLIVAGISDSLLIIDEMNEVELNGDYLFAIKLDKDLNYIDHFRDILSQDFFNFSSDYKDGRLHVAASFKEEIRINNVELSAGGNSLRYFLFDEDLNLEMHDEIQRNPLEEDPTYFRPQIRAGNNNSFYVSYQFENFLNLTDFTPIEIESNQDYLANTYLAKYSINNNTIDGNWYKTFVAGFTNAQDSNKVFITISDFEVDDLENIYLIGGYWRGFNFDQNELVHRANVDDRKMGFLFKLNSNGELQENKFFESDSLNHGIEEVNDRNYAISSQYEEILNYDEKSLLPVDTSTYGHFVGLINKFDLSLEGYLLASKLQLINKPDILVSNGKDIIQSSEFNQFDPEDASKLYSNLDSNQTISYKPDYLWKITMQGYDTSDSLFTIAKPKIEELPLIDMGDVAVGDRKDSIVTEYLNNNSLFEVNFNDNELSGNDPTNFSVLAPLPQFGLAKNSNKNIEVAFMPDRTGPFESEITYKTDYGNFTGKIIGNGVQAGYEQLTKYLDFGKVQIGTVKDTVIEVIQNHKGSFTELEAPVIAGPEMQQFYIDPADEVPKQVTNIAEMKIYFEPTELGYFSTAIRIDANDIRDKVQINVIGQGIDSTSIDVKLFSEEIETELSQYISVPLYMTSPVNLESYNVKYLDVPIEFNTTVIYPTMNTPEGYRFGPNRRIHLQTEYKQGSEVLLDEYDFFTTLGNAEFTDITIIRDSIRFLNEEMQPVTKNINIDTENGKVILTDICYEGGMQLLEDTGLLNMVVMPNPSSGEFILGVNYIEEGSVTITLSDMQGREIETISENIGIPTYKEYLFSVSNLSTGRYMLKIETPTTVISEIVRIEK